MMHCIAWNLEIEGSIAFIEYKLSRDMLFLIHTEVPQVQQVLLCKRHCSTRKDNNYKIVPIFPFAQSYLKRHKEWNYIVAPDAERFIHKL